ncbi:TetR/AcrR family transcriptional regulator [Umezawaea sp. NPDC059074]|uniref:TetR/AcrR family transcriptional regulator n=1 Tax=Umezawaea sp. NPDC059074 TaxID=3346716 RepID=UPI0036B71A0C
MAESVKARQTAEELKAAARRLLTRTTYAEIKITDITEEAGRAAGSFYRHFTDKDHLLRALVEDFEAAVREQVVSTAGHRHSLADRDDVRRHVEAYWVGYRRHHAEMAGVLQASMVSAEFREVHARLRGRQVAIWADHLAESHGDRAATAAFAVVSMLEAVCYDRLRGPSPDGGDVVETLTDLIAGGVLGR